MLFQKFHAAFHDHLVFITSVYNCHNSKEIKLLNLDFPFLFICALKNLNIDFKIHLIPCGLYEEPTSHLPLHCI